MALVLALVFGPPLRLLPLAIALVAAAVTFGLLAARRRLADDGLDRRAAVLIGLAVDYAIQFQARFREALERAAPRRRAPRSRPPRAAGR